MASHQNSGNAVHFGLRLTLAKSRTTFDPKLDTRINCTPITSLDYNKKLPDLFYQIRKFFIFSHIFTQKGVVYCISCS